MKPKTHIKELVKEMVKVELKMINKNSKIFVAGHNGMVGSAICKKLINKGFKK